jgi:hypothetical protein
MRPFSSCLPDGRSKCDPTRAGQHASSRNHSLLSGERPQALAGVPDHALRYFARFSKTPFATVMAENAFGQPA